jgi:dUTP pyrophosphatase
MTEWLNFQRCDHNDLPLPMYETQSSAGVDFSACLTRPCREVPAGASFSETRPFICCHPNVLASHEGNDWCSEYISEFRKRSSVDHIWHIHQKSNKRILVNPSVLTAWSTQEKADTIRLVIYPHETIMVPLGFKCEFGSNDDSVNHVLMLHARSSIGMKGLELANNTGIIDPDYRGELFAVMYNRNDNMPIIVEHGDRLVQGVILQCGQALISEQNELNETNRGGGGFGSTGVKGHGG